MAEQTGVTVFEALFPAEPIPAALVAAEERRLEFAPLYQKLRAIEKDVPERLRAPQPRTDFVHTSDGSQYSEPRSGIGQVQQALISPETCFSGFNCTFPGATWSVGRPFADSLGAEFKIGRDDTTHVRGTGCASIGDVWYQVEYRVWWTWKTWFGISIEENHLLQAWTLYMNNGYDFDFLSYMLTEDPNIGHHCAGGD